MRASRAVCVINRLIATLPRKDRSRLLANCEEVDLLLGEILIEPGERIRYVHFPDDGSFISMITPVDGASALEVGLVGNEGMHGVSLAVGVDASLVHARVRSGGLGDDAKSWARNAEARRIAEELHAFYDNAPCGYHSLDATGLIVEINRTELRWLGYARHEVVGRMRFTDLVLPQYRDFFRQQFGLLKECGWRDDLKYEMRRKDGTTFPVLVNATGIKDGDGRFVSSCAIVLDISVLGRSESERRVGEARHNAADESRPTAEELRAISQKLVEVQETERRNLAELLHGVVGQKLTALSINLNIVKTQLGSAALAQASARLEDSLRLVEETAASVRDVMLEMRPAVLDDFGLAPALRWHAERFGRRTGIAVTVIEGDSAPRPPPAVEEAFFHIAREALANVARHARAQAVTVTLGVTSDTVTLAIADDGCGFDPATTHLPAQDHGWGLMLMRERAISVGSRLNVKSGSGCGTEVTVTWQEDAGASTPTPSRTPWAAA